jgi:hypothetical protein
VTRGRATTTAVLAVAIVLVATACGSGGGRRGGAQGPPGTGEALGALGPSGVRAISLPPRIAPAIAAVGPSLFVFGGSRHADEKTTLLGDGALVDLVRGREWSLPAAPFPKRLGDARAVGAGSRAVVFGTLCSDGPVEIEPDSDTMRCAPDTLAFAAFDTQTWGWHAMKGPPGVRDRGGDWMKALGATHAGKAVFVFDLDVSPSIWTLDPARAEWQRLPDPGIPFRDACVDGDRVAALRLQYKNGDQVLDRSPVETRRPGLSVAGYLGDGYVAPVVASFDTARGGAWSVGPVDPTANFGEQPPDLVCAGEATLVANPVGTAVEVYDAQHGWRRTAPEGRRYFRDHVWNGREVVFLPTEADGASGLAFAPATLQWRSIGGFPRMTRGAVAVPDGAIVGYSEPLSGATASVFRVVPTPPT